MEKSNKPKNIQSISILNKRSSFDYELTTRYTAGIMLTGAEVKSIRAGHASIKEAYCYVDYSGNCVVVKGMYIKNLGILHHSAKTDETRDRKLLLKQVEINEIRKSIEQKGFSLIPVKIFNKKGLMKLEIAIGRGKKNWDKRESIKERDISRDIARGL